MIPESEQIRLEEYLDVFYHSLEPTAQSGVASQYHTIKKEVNLQELSGSAMPQTIGKIFPYLTTLFSPAATEVSITLSRCLLACKYVTKCLLSTSGRKGCRAERMCNTPKYACPSPPASHEQGSNIEMDTREL